MTKKHAAVAILLSAFAFGATAAPSSAERIKWANGDETDTPSKSTYTWVTGAGAPDPSRSVTVAGHRFPAGGVSVGGGRVAYLGGAVELGYIEPGPKSETSTVPYAPKASASTKTRKRARAAASSDCGANRSCLFEHNSYTGSLFSVAGGGNFQMSAYNMNDKASSWINRRSNVMRGYEDWICGQNCGPSGDYITFPPNDNYNSLSPTWNDRISGVKII